LGELYLESGDYSKAEPEFRAEARLSPGSAAVSYKLGLVLANLGRTTEAIAELRRADAAQPGVPETLIELGKALTASGDAASAEPLLQKALSKVQAGDLAASAHFQLANIYHKLGRVADADREMKASSNCGLASRNERSRVSAGAVEGRTLPELGAGEPAPRFSASTRRHPTEGGERVRRRVVRESLSAVRGKTPRREFNSLRSRGGRGHRAVTRGRSQMSD
jgi:Flp pilus assembly protein TadD